MSNQNLWLQHLPIVKHELEDIVSNKKYLVGLFIQFVLLLALVPIFGDYLDAGNLALPTPALREFVTVGVVDNSMDSTVLQAELKKNERLMLEYFSSFPSEQLARGSLDAVVVIPESYVESGKNELLVKVVLSSSIKKNSAKEALEVSIKKASASISEQRKQSLAIALDEPVSIERRFLRPVVIETNAGERYSSFFLGYFIPLALFFPLFMSSGLLLDSVVGEKERRSLESLLSSPLKRSTILHGKFIAIFGFLSFQCLLWLAALAAQGVPIANFGKLFLLLGAVNLCITSIAFVLAVHANGTKEANISLMLFYTLIFIALITSLTIEFFNPVRFSEFLPFSAISRLALGENVSTFSYTFVFLTLCGVSLAAIRTGSWLFERDDILFGPRPSLFQLFTDALSEALSLFESQRVFACSAAALFSGLLAIPLALAVEISFGVVVLYIFGYSSAVMVALIFAFALVEEVLKPLPLYSIRRAKPGWISDVKNGAFFGALSGISFSLIENLFFIALFSFPEQVWNILSLRTGTTMLVHAASSSIAGAGIAQAKGNKLVLFLLLATLLHASYNLLLAEASL